MTTTNNAATIGTHLEDLVENMKRALLLIDAELRPLELRTMELSQKKQALTQALDAMERTETTKAKVQRLEDWKGAAIASAAKLFEGRSAQRIKALKEWVARDAGVALGENELAMVLYESGHFQRGARGWWTRVLPEKAAKAPKEKAHKTT